MPLRPSTIWSWIPPIRDATTARAFHIASATVSPNPLRNALLHDHVGPPLQRVDDRSVLLEIVHRQACQVHTLPRLSVDARDVLLRLLQDPRSFRIVRHRVHRGTRIHQVRVTVRDDVLDEPPDHAQRVLQQVPARYLQHHRVLRPQRLFFYHLRPAADSRRRAVHARERRVHAKATVGVEPGRVQDRADGTIVELLILRRERIDHRGDQLDLAAVKPLPDERLTREHVRVGLKNDHARRDSTLGRSIPT